MQKRQRIALGSGIALAALLVGGLAIALPAQAATFGTPGVTTGGHEDGTADGETNDDGIEDGTNDGETADDASEANEAPGTETDDDGVEDGTNDGETADDAPNGDSATP